MSERGHTEIHKIQIRVDISQSRRVDRSLLDHSYAPSFVGCITTQVSSSHKKDKVEKGGVRSVLREKRGHWIGCETARVGH